MAIEDFLIVVAGILVVIYAIGFVSVVGYCFKRKADLWYYQRTRRVDYVLEVRRERAKAKAQKKLKKNRQQKPAKKSSDEDFCDIDDLYSDETEQPAGKAANINGHDLGLDDDASDDVVAAQAQEDEEVVALDKEEVEAVQPKFDSQGRRLPPTSPFELAKEQEEK